MEFLMVIIMVTILFLKLAMNEEKSQGEGEAASPLLKTDGERATAREMTRRGQEGRSLSSTDWQAMLKDGKSAVQQAGKKAARIFDEADSGVILAREMRERFAGAGKKSRPDTVAMRERHEARLGAEWEANNEKNRRERAQSAARFAAARTKQANAEQLHTVHIDSCEGRLESLKVLYEAGILDREEYQMRVKRTKKLHRESGNA